MHSVAKFEQNSLRRSHRNTIPLRVMIENQNYEALDWSLTGLALEDFSVDMRVGESVQAFLSLPMPEATLSIMVRLQLRYAKSNRYGFAYENLSNSNKKVLRRYVEMAIDGDAHDTNALVALYQEPDIQTPINEPVKLDDIEKDQLSKEFHRTSWRYILFSALFFAVLAGLLYYNLRYSYVGMGVIKGNDYPVFAHKAGKIDKIYVKENQEVSKLDSLVQIDTEAIQYKISLLESEKKRALFLAKSIQNSQYSKNSSKSYFSALREKVASKKKIYNNAKIQFREKLITAVEFQKAKDNYLDSKIKLAKSLKDKETRFVDTSDIDIKMQYAKDELKLSRLVALEDAKVYEIYKREGEIVTTNMPILTLWTKEKPHIEVNIPNDTLSKISMDTKVEIINPLTKKHTDATIYKIGSIDEERGSRFATVYLRTKESLGMLKPHQRVRVLFKRVWFW